MDELRTLNASLTTQLKKTRLREHKQKIQVAEAVGVRINQILRRDNIDETVRELQGLSAYLDKYTFWVKFSDDMEVLTLHDGYNADADKVIQLPIIDSLI